MGSPPGFHFAACMLVRVGLFYWKPCSYIPPPSPFWPLTAPVGLVATSRKCYATGLRGHWRCEDKMVIRMVLDSLFCICIGLLLRSHLVPQKRQGMLSCHWPVTKSFTVFAWDGGVALVCCVGVFISFTVMRKGISQLSMPCALTAA